MMFSNYNLEDSEDQYDESNGGLYDIKIIEISFDRRKNKKSFIFFKKIINELEKESDIEKINSNINFKIEAKVIELNQENKNPCHWALNFYQDDF